MRITPDEDDLLKQVAALYDYPEYDPARHVTAQSIMDEWDITDKGAHYRLDKLVRQGYLKFEMIRMPSGAVAKGYYRVTT